VIFKYQGPAHIYLENNCKHVRVSVAVLSKVDNFATFKKVEVHAENSTR